MTVLAPDSMSTSVLYSTARIVNTMKDGSTSIGTAYFLVSESMAK